MATLSRLERLQAAVAARPGDPFGWYSLAMEQRKTDLEAARATFERVQREHPTYLPTFYQLAKLLIEQGARDAAREVLDAGLTLAHAQRDAHTLGELQGLRDSV